MSDKITLKEAKEYVRSLKSKKPPLDALDQISRLEILAKKVKLGDDETFDYLDKEIGALMEICFPSEKSKKRVSL